MKEKEKATPLVIKGKVTTAVLRKMEIGQSITFEVPNAELIDIGKSIAYRVKNYGPYKFTAVSDFPNKRLTLTKIAR